VKIQKKATLLSLFVMGFGQLFITKERYKGLFFLITEMILVLNYRFFYQSLRGLITLGEVTGYTGSDIIKNDHSIVLLIRGILALFIVALFLGTYILNILDAHSTAKRIENGQNPKSLSVFIKDFWDNAFPYIMLSPAALLILFFIILPVTFGILIAFTNYSAPDYIPPKVLVDWVGFKNVLDMVRLPMWNKTFVGIFVWNVIWAVASSSTCYFAGLLVALLLNHKRVFFKRLWRTIFILPYSVPALISLLVWYNLANGQFGPINLTLKSLGIIDPYFGIFANNIGWLSEPILARVTVILVNLWLGFPYFMALLTGVLTSISEELYEAADIDGASPFQKFYSITLPMVIKATTPIITMTFAANFNNFNAIYFLTGGGPDGMYDAGAGAGGTDILITWIYKLTMDRQMYNIAALMSLLIFIVIGSLSVYNFTKTGAFKED
jgi:arabinogalactan oligomer / maltooligosaccharide transport system permease protein